VAKIIKYPAGKSKPDHPTKTPPHIRKQTTGLNRYPAPSIFLLCNYCEVEAEVEIEAKPS
jgi:hypothetical protein